VRTSRAGAACTLSENGLETGRLLRLAKTTVNRDEPLSPLRFVHSKIENALT